MFFGYDFMMDSNSLSNTATNSIINGIQVENGIIEHLNLMNLINTASGVFDTAIPTTWTNDTILNCSFNNTLDGGSVSDIIGNINSLEIQRQQLSYDINNNTWIQSGEWITLQTIYKNPVTQELKGSFTMYDPFAQNGAMYVYQIVPIDAEGNVGTSLQQQVLSYFGKAFICDANNIYDITNEYTLNFSTNQKSAVYEPYGSKYPFVAYNAVTKYKSGTIETTPIINANKMNGHIDRLAQVAFLNEFNSWLTNGRAKILKDFNGNVILITINESPSSSYFKELGNGIASLSINWVEVGAINQQYLSQLGMVENFNLQYKNG